MHGVVSVRHGERVTSGPQTGRCQARRRPAAGRPVCRPPHRESSVASSITVGVTIVRKWCPLVVHAVTRPHFAASSGVRSGEAYLVQ